MSKLLRDYRFVTAAAIEPQEIISLRKSVGWNGGSPRVWQQCLEQQNGIVIGVRNSVGVLVGMGRVTSDPRHAVLCDLVVNPEHQGRGIATAIIQKRIELVDRKRIPYLYTDLSEGNPLFNTYISAGFTKREGSLFRSRAN